MASFKDNNGREWQLNLDGPGIFAVRAGADPEFLKGDAIDTIERYRADMVQLCFVVHALCQKQIADKGLSNEEFFEHVIGDAIESATKALIEAILVFIPSHTRKIVETCAAQNAKIRETAMEKAIAAINDPNTMKQVEADLEAEIEAQIKQARTRLSSATN